MSKIFYSLFFAIFVACLTTACNRSGSGDKAAPSSSEEPPRISVPQALSERAQQTAGRFYDWLTEENYASLQAMFDAESIPDQAWMEALLADLRDKRQKLGLPTERNLRSLELMDSADNRKIYIAVYRVLYSKGFQIQETLYLIPKAQDQIKILDYAYDSTG